jgi:hypothetical protein
VLSQLWSKLSLSGDSKVSLQMKTYAPDDPWIHLRRTSPTSSVSLDCIDKTPTSPVLLHMVGMPTFSMRLADQSCCADWQPALPDGGRLADIPCSGRV